MGKTLIYHHLRHLCIKDSALWENHHKCQLRACGRSKIYQWGGNPRSWAILAQTLLPLWAQFGRHHLSQPGWKHFREPHCQYLGLGFSNNRELAHGSASCFTSQDLIRLKRCLIWLMFVWMHFWHVTRHFSSSIRNPTIMLIAIPRILLHIGVSHQVLSQSHALVSQSAIWHLKLQEFQRRESLHP